MIYREPLKDLRGRRPYRGMYPQDVNGTPQQRVARAFSFDPNEYILTTHQLGPSYEVPRPIDLTTPAAQFFLRKLADLIDQRGGPSNITPAEKMIIANAATIDVELAILRGEYFETGRRLEPHVFGSLAKVQRGLLDSVGLKRRRKHINPRSINGDYTEVANPDTETKLKRAAEPSMRRTR